MEEFYVKREKKNFNRESIIGLGEESFRKNYYPELQRKLNDLEKMNARNQALIAAIPDILFVCDGEGSMERMDSSDETLNDFGDKVMGEEVVMEELLKAVQEVKRRNVFFSKEFQVTKDGENYFFEARLVKSETNEVLIIIRDMTPRILLVQQLQELGEQDSLTRLKNRRKFEERMEILQGHFCEKITMILFDIVGLKRVNDEKGHMFGDQTIIKVADLIGDVFGDYGLVARINGDEFGVILEGYDESVAIDSLDKLEKCIAYYNKQENIEPLSLAYGYAHHQDGVAMMGNLFKEADDCKIIASQKIKKERSFEREVSEQDGYHISSGRQ